MKVDGHYSIEGRTAALPNSVSPEAYAFLLSMLDASVQSSVLSSTPAPSDISGWRGAQAAMAKYMDDIAERMDASYHSEVSCVEIDGRKVYIAADVKGTRDQAYLDFHAGGLVYGGGAFCRAGARRVADEFGITCYAPDYPMPPDDRFPAALDSGVSLYRALLERYDPTKIIIGGASAGGNLAAATVLRARDEGLPMPAGLVLISPELDLTESGDSFETNRFHDFVLPMPLINANLLYAGGANLSHPYLSPLFGDFSLGFPPTFIQAGTRDLFLSNAVRMHRSLRRAGQVAELHIFEAMPHGGFGGAPEDMEVVGEIRRFIAEILYEAI